MSPAFAPLRHRGFRFLIAGQSASNVGDLFYAVALPWYVLSVHGGALLLGTVLAVYGIPRTALLVVSGHAADRWRPWNVMMVADLTRAIAVTALAIAAYAGPARAYVLIPIALVLGAGEGLFLPGSFAIVPSLVPGGELAAANALSSSGTQIATLVGPALGGVVVAAVGPASAFVVDAASFLLSALTLFGIRAIEGRALLEATARTPDSAEDHDGDVASTPSTLRHLFRTERVLPIMVGVIVAANLGFGGMGEVALPDLVRTSFHDGASGYGALIAALGAGSLLGTLLAGQSARVRRPTVIGSWAFIVGAAFLSLTPYLGGTVPAGVVLAVFGISNGFGNVSMLTLMQRWAPPAMMGRLMGVVMLASMGVFPLSVFLGGVIVTRTGPAIFFPLASALLALALLVGLSQRVWRDFGMVREPAPDAEATAP